MQEFEIMPSDEQIMLMANEFNKIGVRKSVIKCDCYISGGDIAKAYFVEADLIHATRVLYSLANPSMREIINNIIITKRKNAQRLLNLYVKAAGAEMPDYAPKLLNKKKFCIQLADIDYIQDGLIMLLNQIEDCNAEINKVINNELMVSYFYNKLNQICNNK